jgi:hypothetical protein
MTNLSADLVPENRVCGQHGHKQWVDCYNCGGEGYSDHDCGEDCCCCLDPEPNVECDICEGDGGWWACFSCNPEAFDD